MCHWVFTPKSQTEVCNKRQSSGKNLVWVARLAKILLRSILKVTESLQNQSPLMLVWGETFAFQLDVHQASQQKRYLKLLHSVTGTAIMSWLVNVPMDPHAERTGARPVWLQQDCGLVLTQAASTDKVQSDGLKVQTHNSGLKRQPS